jgi:hypothetical protein
VCQTLIAPGHLNELVEAAGPEVAKASARFCSHPMSAVVVSGNCELVLQQGFGQLCITANVFAEPMSDLNNCANVMRTNPLYARYGLRLNFEREEPSAGTTINSAAPSFPGRRSANERFDSNEFLLSQFVHFCVAWKTRRPFARDDNLWCAKRSRGLLE